MTSSNSRPRSSGMTPATSRATTRVFRICTNSSESMVVLIPLYGTKFLLLWDKTAAALTDLINWDITTVLG